MRCWAGRITRFFRTFRSAGRRSTAVAWPEKRYARTKTAGERASGDPTWLRWEIRPWGERSGRPEGLLIFSEDITARKRMEATLRESEATIRALLETAAQSILAVDLDGTVVLANRMAVEMFGHGHSELLGMSLEKLIPERFRTRHFSYRTEFAANPRTRPMGVGIDLQGLRKDGTEFPIEVSLSTVQTSRGTLAVAFVTDITTRKQAETSLRNSENELRALARSLLTAQEDERRRVARDLHDDVTQRLALLSIEIGKLAAATSSSVDEIATRLRSFQSQARHASNEVRRLSHGLHPSVIEDFGLSTALEEFCGEFATRPGNRPEIRWPGRRCGTERGQRILPLSNCTRVLAKRRQARARDGGSRRARERRCERSAWW